MVDGEIVWKLSSVFSPAVLESRDGCLRQIRHILSHLDGGCDRYVDLLPTSQPLGLELQVTVKLRLEANVLLAPIDQIVLGPIFRGSPVAVVPSLRKMRLLVWNSNFIRGRAPCHFRTKGFGRSPLGMTLAILPLPGRTFALVRLAMGALASSLELLGF